MASIVKFKFKSAREYDSVSFPGTGIKLLDLKRAIVEQKKLHQGMEFDLNIVNDKTREEYKEDNVVVTKNTSVTVKRVPAHKSGGLLSKIKALDAAAALRATATATTTASTKYGSLLAAKRSCQYRLRNLDSLTCYCYFSSFFHNAFVFVGSLLSCRSAEARVIVFVNVCRFDCLNRFLLLLRFYPERYISKIRKSVQSRGACARKSVTEINVGGFLNLNIAQSQPSVRGTNNRKMLRSGLLCAALIPAGVFVFDRRMPYVSASFAAIHTVSTQIIIS